MSNDVDRLGVLKAQIADLETQTKILEERIKASGPGTYEGALFSATVSVAQRVTLIADKVREFLHSNQLRHCTSVTDVVSLRVAARKAA